MKKEIIISALAIFLIATPAFAKQENPKENSTKNNQNQRKDTDSLIQEISVSKGPSIRRSTRQSTRPSSAASSKPQSKLLIEEREKERQSFRLAYPTCRPEVEYRNHGEYVSCVAREHRGGKEVSEAARSEIGKKHPFPTATISPITSSLPSIQGGFNAFKSIEENLHRFFGFLLHFI